MEHHGKFGHTSGWIYHIFIMSRIYIRYIAFHLGTQTVVTTLPCFQNLKHCILYLSSHPKKYSFVLLIIMMAKISSDSYLMGLKFNTTQSTIFYNVIKTQIIPLLLT